VQTVNTTRGINNRQTSHHAFAIIGDDVKFLTDTTFGQLVEPSGLIRVDAEDESLTSSINAADPTIRSLLQRGYVLLTDKSFTTYMDAMTSTAAQKSPLTTRVLTTDLAYIINATQRGKILSDLRQFHNFNPKTLRRN
jgi:hypothetical protein